MESRCLDVYTGKELILKVYFLTLVSLRGRDFRAVSVSFRVSKTKLWWSNYYKKNKLVVPDNGRTAGKRKCQ